jgi:flagellar biosynthetic protein FlhB
MLGGLVFSAKSLQPKFSKLNPLPGIAKMFSRRPGRAGQSHSQIGADGQFGGFYLWYTGRK